MTVIKNDIGNVFSLDNVIPILNFTTPYFLIIDSSNFIIEIGNNFKNSVDGIKIGSSFEDFFIWESQFRIDDILKRDKLLFFTTIDKKQKYKCSLVKGDNQSFIILANAIINSQFNLLDYKLSLNDFPKHDYIAEFIFLQQASTKGLAELNLFNQSLNVKNKELVFSKQMLVNANAILEKRVSERTNELVQKQIALEESLEKLYSIQNEMIHQEKMATLGLLIAGISHEINTPLGAINASCKTLVDTINKDIISELNNLEYTDYKSSIRLLSLVNHDRKYLTTREERELLSSISKQLNEKAPFISEINFYARKLLEMGFSDIDIRLISFLELPNSRNIFSIASGFARLNRVLDTISIATNRATKVVKTLNNYSHGNLNGILTTFNLKESIENTISLLNNKIKNGSSVFVNIHEDVFITGNQEELSQIWTNIINNALQASNNKCTIKIDYLLIENTDHRIIISNNGPAIPKELLSKIFDPFFTTKKLGQGSGIGLDIVKKIIEKHSGKINVESDEKETAFEITIPLKLLKDE